MKTLTTRAADLSARRELRPLPLVLLTTYTDRGAQTGPSVHYYSDRSVLYPYGAAGEKEFAPFLLGLDALAQEMNHLPDLDNRSLEREMSIQLANLSVDGGSRLYEVLDAENLLFATVEVAQLLFDPGKRDTLATIRALTGNEHQVWFRGEVVSHECDEREITLTVRATQRAVPWIVANDPTKNDPSDLGRRLPIVYGARPKVQAVGWEIGWVTTTAELIASSTSTGDVAVTDASGFPQSGSFTCRIGNEDTTASYVDDQKINLSERGVNSTRAVLHGTGEAVTEALADVHFIVAGHSLSAINEIYVANATGDGIVRIPYANAANYTKNLSNATLISGETVASISFTAAQLKRVLDEIYGVVAYTGTQSISVELSTKTIYSPASGNNCSVTADSYYKLWVNSGVDQGINCRIASAPPNAASKVYRTRLIANYGLHADSSATIYFYVAGSQIDTKSPGTGDEYGLRYAFGWVYPASGTTVNDYVGANVSSYLGITGSPGGTGGTVFACKLEREFEIFNETAAPISASLLGFGLRLFADIEGPVSDGRYSVAAYTLLEHPADILWHFIAERCGYGHDAIDGPSFAALVTSLGSGAKIAPLINELGDDFETVVAELAQECRANIVQEESFKTGVADPPPIGFATTQQPSSYSSTWAEVENACPMDGSDVTWTDIDSGETQKITYNFADFGSSFQRQTLRLRCRSTTGTATVKIYDGVTLLHSFTGVTTTPAWFEWTTVDYNNLNAFTIAVTGNQLRLYQVERAADIETTIVAQTGTSATGDTPYDENLVIDGDPNTWIQFNLVPDSYVEVTFPTPTAGYYSQRILIRMVGRFYDTHYFTINGVTLPTQEAQPPADYTVSDISWEFAETGDVVRLTISNGWYQVHEITRELLYNPYVAPDPPPAFVYGTLFEVYAASTAWAWGASERTIDQFESVKVRSRDGSDVATRFRWLYAPDLSKQSEEDIWTAALRADPDDSDLASLTITTLANAEKQYGRRDHPGMALATVYDSATAIDVATYYGKELSRDARVLEVTGIPWWLGYDLERGSIVSITPRWSATALKCRVVSYIKNFDNERVDATLVEVT